MMAGRVMQAHGASDQPPTIGRMQLLSLLLLCLAYSTQGSAGGVPAPSLPPPCLEKGVGPWMTDAEVTYIASLLTRSTRMLEWGSGGSTRCFPQMVGTYFSIEHDSVWHDKISAEMAGRPGLHYQLAAVAKGTEGWGGGLNPGNYRQFKDYVHAVDNFGALLAGGLDVVLVDGRARVACAVYALRHLRSDSVLLIHDFYQPQNRVTSRKYGQVFRFYDEVHRIDSLVALRPKPEFLQGGSPGPEGVDLHSLYASHSRRQPSMRHGPSRG